LHGDANTAYFHVVANGHIRKCNIIVLSDIAFDESIYPILLLTWHGHYATANAMIRMGHSLADLA
jgi:hypothetical protein